RGTDALIFEKAKPLRDRSAEALAVLGKRSPALASWAREAFKGVKQAPTVDASETFAYFWDETSDEETFSLADLPPISLPPAAVGDERGGVLFVEGAAPSRGLPMSMIVDDGKVGRLPVGHLANSVMVEDKPPAMIIEDEPGLVVLKDALISRAGALLVWNHSPAQARGLYSSLGCAAPTDVWGTLTIVPFYEHTKRLGNRMGPQQLTIHLPLGPDGQVLVIPRGDESLPINVLGRRYLPPELSDALAAGQRPLLLMTLFAAACLGSPLAEMAATDLGHNGSGCRQRLVIENIVRVLDEKGNARELGLGHALAACDAWFEDG
ncbi:MAG: hypothetical protein ACFB50_16425, partial [Rubrobacteraceae bacterium]